MPSHYFDKEKTQRTFRSRKRELPIEQNRNTNRMTADTDADTVSFRDRPTSAEMFKPAPGTTNSRTPQQNLPDTIDRTTQSGREALTASTMRARQTAEASGTLDEHLRKRRTQRQRRR